jgi:hypothetical protein
MVRDDSIAKMASWPNFKLFRPKLSPNWTKNGQLLSFLVQIRPKMATILEAKNGKPTLLVHMFILDVAT